MKKVMALALLLVTANEYGMGRNIATMATNRVVDVGNIISQGVTSINTRFQIVEPGKETAFALGAVGVTAAFFAAKELVSKTVAFVALAVIVGACAVGKGIIKLPAKQ